MKPKQWNCPKGANMRRSRRYVSRSSSNIKGETYAKGTLSTNSRKPSLMERLMSLSLQARLSNPISRCSTIGTESARSVTQMSGEVSEDEPVQVLREKGISESKETR